QAHRLVLDLHPTGAEAELYDRLRSWRADTARERNVPAYVIFHDATLLEIANRKPDSLEALGAVSGIGDRKLDAYGPALLELLTA
nr:HRDC domain-containing protein [Denitromonas sp.]